MKQTAPESFQMLLDVPGGHQRLNLSVEASQFIVNSWRAEARAKCLPLPICSTWFIEPTLTPEGELAIRLISANISTKKNGRSISHGPSKKIRK